MCECPGERKRFPDLGKCFAMSWWWTAADNCFASIWWQTEHNLLKLKQSLWYVVQTHLIEHWTFLVKWEVIPCCALAQKLNIETCVLLNGRSSFHIVLLLGIEMFCCNTYPWDLPRGSMIIWAFEICSREHWALEHYPIRKQIVFHIWIFL